MQEIELKSCPFCGGEAEIKTEFEGYFAIWCECEKCHAKTERYCLDIKHGDVFLKIDGAKNGVVYSWNRRA